LLAPLCAVTACALIGVVNPASYPYFESGARARGLLDVGARILSQYGSGVRVLAPEIGALGFSFPGKVLDAAGLVTPAALRYHPLQVPGQRSAGFIGAAPASFIAETKPDVVVGLSIFFEEFLRSTADQEYRRSTVSPLVPSDRILHPDGRVFGTSQLFVFTRIGLEPFASDDSGVRP
jgi:acetamidase/formamidase